MRDDWSTQRCFSQGKANCLFLSPSPSLFSHLLPTPLPPLHLILFCSPLHLVCPTALVYPLRCRLSTAPEFFPHQPGRRKCTRMEEVAAADAVGMVLLLSFVPVEIVACSCCRQFRRRLRLVGLFSALPSFSQGKAACLFLSPSPRLSPPTSFCLPCI